VVTPESHPVTAFVTPDHHCKWLHMPFGVMNAPAIFQRAVHQGLRNVLGNIALTYLDDVLIGAAAIDEALLKLEKTLKTLRGAGLTLRLSKCKFLATKLEYLGHELSGQPVRSSSFLYQKTYTKYDNSLGWRVIFENTYRILEQL